MLVKILYCIPKYSIFKGKRGEKTEVFREWGEKGRILLKIRKRSGIGEILYSLKL